MTAATAGLLARLDHEAGRRAGLCQAQRLIVGAGEPVVGLQDEAGRQPGFGGHDNRAAAAACAWLSNVLGCRQNTTLRTAVTPITTRNSRPTG